MSVAMASGKRRRTSSTLAAVTKESAETICPTWTWWLSLRAMEWALRVAISALW